MTIDNGLLGLIALVVPLLLIGLVVLRRLPWILAFFVVLLAVGSGYLHTTGALDDVGKQVRPYVPAGMLVEHTTATPEATTPAAPPAAEAPAMKPAEPPAMAPAAPAPAPTPPPAPAPAPANP